MVALHLTYLPGSSIKWTFGFLDNSALYQIGPKKKVFSQIGPLRNNTIVTY